MIPLRFGLFICTAAMATAVHAEQVRLPFVAPPFTDHMVLQRDRCDPVWGWATPGETITVTMGGCRTTAVAGPDGKWLARFTPPAVGGPYELTIAGTQTRTFTDVLVGDVWLCAGQSNMEFGLKNTVDAEAEIAKADHPRIRLFCVGKTTALHPVDTLTGQWRVCAPATVQEGTWGGFSAVGYFFGRELHRELKIPIGLIQAAWGSTPAEAWTGRKGLEQMAPDFTESLAGLRMIDQALQAGTYDPKRLRDAWYAQIGIGPETSTPAFDASAWKTMRWLPHLWGTNDDPLLRDFQGAVWFRKEIDLPAAVEGRAAELALGSLDDGDVTWINGEQVGAEMSLAPRRYQVRAGLLRPGRNLIAIWLLNATGAGGMAGKPADLALTVPGLDAVPLAGDWRYRIHTAFERMPPRLFMAKNNAEWPTQIFNAMIAPLAPFGIMGVIWYQGEANVARAHQYRRLLPALITDWRDQWQQGDFPFLVVQLPNFGRSPGIRPAACAQAELREAQALAATTLSNVGVVTTIDIGDPGDLHPRDKREVGRRLGLLARAQVHHEMIPFSGPVYRTCVSEGQRLRIAFAHAEGLCTRDGKPLRNCAVAGEDRVFHWAEAVIVGNEVVLTTPAVSRPVAARYGWDWNPDGNLSNQTGLPAFPFRTDDWPGITAGKP